MATSTTAQAIQKSLDAEALTPIRHNTRNTDKKMGVWVNGKLKLQTRDYAAIINYRDKMITDHRNNVWVAPIGSFVTV